MDEYTFTIELRRRIDYANSQITGRPITVSNSFPEEYNGGTLWQAVYELGKEKTTRLFLIRRHKSPQDVTHLLNTTQYVKIGSRLEGQVFEMWLRRGVTLLSSDAQVVLSAFDKDINYLLKSRK